MLVLYFFISLFSSVMGAISGIGGGVIIKPVLDSLSPFDTASISFLSGCTVLSMTTVTLLKSRKSSINLNHRTALTLAAGGVIGGLAGKSLFDFVTKSFYNAAVIGISQSLLLALLTIFVFFFTLYKQKFQPHHKNSFLFTMFTGFLLGSLASFLGIGGGPINLAILYFFFSMDSKTAALNSIFIIFFSQLTSLVFTLVSKNIPPFNPVILTLMIAGGIGGGLAGSLLSKNMSHRAVDKLFMGVMGMIILICLYNILKWF